MAKLSKKVLPPKKIRMLATYMWRMSNNLEIRIAGSSCRPQLYFV